MILFKTNVRMKTLSPELLHIFNNIYSLNHEKIPNYPVDWTITSINDSQHMPDSRHYRDQALDLRSKNFENQSIKLEFRDRLMFLLGRDYTVLLESIGTDNEHFHVQLKKGL